MLSTTLGSEVTEIRVSVRVPAPHTALAAWAAVKVPQVDTAASRLSGLLARPAVRRVNRVPRLAGRDSRAGNRV